MICKYLIKLVMTQKTVDNTLTFTLVTEYRWTFCVVHTVATRKNGLEITHARITETCRSRVFM